MLSVIILTKNEEKNILDCLESIYWADEIIIVDDFSEDRTLDVAKTYDLSEKIKFFQNKLDNNFSQQRNFALSKATHDWVLFLDADERVPKELREEINISLIEDKKNKKFNGFFIKRLDVMWGKALRHGESGSVRLLRLARKGFAHWNGKVHEEWIVEGNISTFDAYFLHYPHQTISEFLKEINFYTTLRAQELFEKKEKPSVLNILLYPKLKFLKNYILKLGFLDGIEGFIFSLFMSFHSFLVRGKLWLLWQKK